MKILLTFIICLNLNLTFSQSFEGIVDYELSYISKSPKYSVEFMEKEFGTNVRVFFKDGYYKELTDTKYMSLQLYRNDENRIYYKHEIEDDTLRYFPAIKNLNETFDYKLEKDKEVILSKLCNKLIVNDSYGTKTYYYSSDYPIDPELFKEYTYANKYEILKIMRAIYLKLVMEYEPFTVTYIATDIKPKRLRNKEFKIPNYEYIKRE
jgi:hypothetical protein